MEGFRQLIVWGSLAAFAFIAMTAEPRYFGVFRKHLGHASSGELMRSANQTVLIFGVVTVGSALLDRTSEPGWQERVLAGTIGYLACYVALIARAGR